MITKLNTLALKGKATLNCAKARLTERFTNNDGADFVDNLIKILIAVVIGALLLGLLYALVNALFPQITQKITELFNFNGGSAGTASTSNP